MRRSAINTIVVATAVAPAVASANAQSRSAAQTTQATPTSAIPEKIPANWSANGWDQAGWTALRQQCLYMLVESNRRAHMSFAQRRGLKPIPGDWEVCKHLASSFTAQPGPASPSAAPTTNAMVSGIPEKAPQWFIAEGSTQAHWTAIRENCNRNIAEMTRRGRLSAAQRSTLPPFSFSHQDLMLCAHLSVSPPDSAQTSPATVPAGIAPTPMSTPLPMDRLQDQTN